jgi:hypothetical protein
MATHQTDYTTPVRGVRSYKGGAWCAIITRSTPEGVKSYYRGGLRSLEAAIQAHAELEAAYPKRKPGRKPGCQR